MNATRARRQQRSRRNGRRARLSSPWLEWLERRVVLSSISWINPNGGDWDTPANWSNDEVPMAADDVTITIAVSNPITHDAVNADSVDSVTSDDPIVLAAGSLSIASASTFSSTVTLSGGTLAGGPITMTDGATIVGTYNNANGGTLSGVTLDGTLDLATNIGANVTVKGGLTLNGTIAIGNSTGSSYGQLNFVGAQSLGGSGAIVFGGNGGNQINTAASNGDSGALTIGAGITIHGKIGMIGYNAPGNQAQGPATPLINQGTIAGDVKGGGINVYGANWSNSGTLEGTNSGGLGLNNTWTSTGLITADGGSVEPAGTWTDYGPMTVSDAGSLTLTGAYSLGAGASIGGDGGTVYIEGALNNTGTTLALDDPSLVYVLDTGTISGGAVAVTGGATLVGVSNNGANGGTLSGVTLDGTLDLATNIGANVTVKGGLTLNGTIAIGNSTGSSYGQLNFVGAQSLGGSGAIVFGGNGGNQINTAASNGDSGALTIGAGITIHGKIGMIGYNAPGNQAQGPATPLINQGTIADDVKGGGINVYGANWSNSGTLEGTNSGGLGLNNTWTSTGLITADGGSVEPAGTWTDYGPMTVSDAGSLTLTGAYSLGAGASIGGDGGTVYIEGALNNTGTTLALDDPSLVYVLDTGTISGGAVAVTGGATLVGVSNNGANGGTLSGVTLDGTLDLATNIGANVTVKGGLTLNGTIAIGNSTGSSYGQLNFVGAQSLGGSGAIVFGGNGGNQINTAASNGDSGALTIGAGITIHGKIGMIGYNAPWEPGSRPRHTADQSRDHSGRRQGGRDQRLWRQLEQ